MTETKKCSKCGATLPADAPGGHCLSCLLQLGLQPVAPPVEEASAPYTEHGTRNTQHALVAPKSDEGGTRLPDHKPGDRIGHYKLLQQIGEGGCGIVYMAEQEQPVRRRVALKIIKLGMDTRNVIARFEAERQALAMMDHPNIAKVFDAGATPTGRPYFVMELVRGVKITSYCDQQNLSTRQRLDLFIPVCQAIQHAHQKGVIHRDLKPSNILVTEQDGKPVPKVIDFGIAKATTDQRLTDKTLFTAFEQFLGTPAYMSPEQAGLGGLDIDTRSDIYSLGVLLYELLTGQPPFDANQLARSALDEILRVIREKEPPRPSARLTTLTEQELTIVAQRHQIESTKLPNLLRGDLDWIVMKALEKDRTRRYETANGFATDIQRHLNNEPVVARPSSAAYRFRKLVRRNKIAVAATSAVAAALVIGLAASAWLFLREKAARQRAVIAEQKSQTEAKKSQQVAEFLKDMLKGVGPSLTLGRDAKMLKEILDKTAERIGIDLNDQPEVEAELRSVIGNTYIELADYSKAEAMHREALRLGKASFGETNKFVAASLNDLGVVLLFQGRFADAEPILRTALAMRTRLFGNETLDVANTLHNVAHLVALQGNDPEAETLHHKALEVQRRFAGNESPEVALTLTRLVPILRRQGKLAEAETLGREAVVVFTNLHGNEHPQLAFALARLATVLRDRGKLAEAETMFRQALEMQTKLLGNAHPDVAINLNNLVSMLKAQGKTAEAESLYDELLQKLRSRLPADDPALASALATRASTLLQEAKFAEAEPLALECLTICEKKLPDDWSTFNARSMLGGSLLGQKKYPQAEPLLVSGYEGMKQREDKIPADSKHLRLTEALQRLVRFYEATGQTDLTAKWKTEVAQWYRNAADQGSFQALNNLAWRLAACVDSAMRDGTNAVTFAEKAVMATKRKDPMILDTLAAAYAENGEFAKAVSVQNEAIALLHDVIVKGDYASRLRLYESNSPYRAP